MCIRSVYDIAMKKITYKRINITLPESTVAMLETVADNGARSTFIDAAIKKYIHEIRKQDLREQIKVGAIANAERDLEMAREWFDLEEEVWRG
ncbi:hypothetical protein BH20ACI2_BH20ACI2_10700 [soil metagenome]